MDEIYYEKLIERMVAKRNTPLGLRLSFPNQHLGIGDRLIYNRVIRESVRAVNASEFEKQHFHAEVAFKGLLIDRMSEYEFRCVK